MYEQLMEQAVERENRVEALRAVVRNGGSPGIDRMTVKELKEHVAKHWESIREKLLAGNYTPSPVKRVDIPKPGGGTRMLGIPTVMDRFVQQLLLGVLQPIFEPRFSEHSYGFRPGRGAHDAIKAAQKYVQEGKEWVVDIDISKFFDHVNHDILMAKIGAVIRDKRVMRLIGRYLRAGIMSEGVVVAREEGTPQGGPLSPMLANVYLDALDKELEGRGLGFCRYADDCNIYVGSQQAAQRVMEKIVGWIEEKLRLKVNPDKSAAGKVWERKFLGFRINPEGQIEVAPQSLQRFKDKVRKLWRSCQSLRSVELRERWCAFVRGWWGYFRQAEATRPVFRLEPWIRRQMRKCFWQRWHDKKGRRKRLQQLGIRGQELKIASSGRGAWRVAKTPTLHRALSNKTLRRYGFLLPSELAGPQPLGSTAGC
ncbi:MAG TPA: group II intron reverse transcriptase/maturase [Candidatus Acidoferrum sp.]|nr:group II intron reverse transcriptase/maturase [Candidatus Acidoferrum sp.]